MFDNTMSIYHRTRKELMLLKKLIDILEICAFAFGILYQIYMLASGSNIWYVHVILLILSTAHFIYKLVFKSLSRSISDSQISKTKKRRTKKEFKQKARLERKIYKISSILIRAFVIGTSVYSIIVAPKIIKVICTTLISAELIIEILFELIKAFVEKRIKDFKAAIDEDINLIKSVFKEPVTKAKEFYNDISDTFAKSKPISKVVGWIGKKLSKTNNSYIETEEYKSLPDSVESKEDETV